MNNQAVACLMFGIYERSATGVVDRRECAVCHGDYCPYVVGETQHGICPRCFGTGLAPAALFDAEERGAAQCPLCGGTGKL